MNNFSCKSQNKHNHSCSYCLYEVEEMAYLTASKRHLPYTRTILDFVLVSASVSIAMLVNHIEETFTMDSLTTSSLPLIQKVMSYNYYQDSVVIIV